MRTQRARSTTCAAWARTSSGSVIAARRLRAAPLRHAGAVPEGPAQRPAGLGLRGDRHREAAPGQPAQVDGGGEPAGDLARPGAAAADPDGRRGEVDPARLADA